MKCVFLNNQQCVTQPALINLHPNDYIKVLRYYPFAVDLDRCMGSCNTFDDLSNKVSVSNKKEDLNLSVFNMMAAINESKILRKHISCKCKYTFDSGKCNSNQKLNDNKC